AVAMREQLPIPALPLPVRCPVPPKSLQSRARQRIAVPPHGSAGDLTRRVDSRRHPGPQGPHFAFAAKRALDRDLTAARPRHVWQPRGFERDPPGCAASIALRRRKSEPCFATVADPDE